MAYDGTVSFSAGEQPSAAKWNKLPANDASFHDGTGIDNKVIVSRHLEDLLRRGWFDIHTATGTVETCTYVSADAPSFVFSVPGDRTADIWAGMRFTGTQATGGQKFFIITLVTFDAGNNRTLVTIYGGTDYVLTNQTITSPAFATAKAPVGFPVSTIKWTVEVKSTSDVTQNTPSDATIYNTFGNISLPIGSWNLSFSMCIRVNGGAVNKQVYVGLSTANNTFSDVDMKLYGLAADTTGYMAWPMTSLPKNIVVASKTPYYLNCQTINSPGSFSGQGSIQPTLIRAVCAYL